MTKYLAVLLLIAALSSADETVKPKVAKVVVEKPQYLITSPHRYRIGYAEEVGVHLFGSRSCEVEVWLRDNSWGSKKQIVVSDKKVFKPGVRGTLSLKIPRTFVSPGRRHYYQHSFELQAKVCGKETEKKSIYGRVQKYDNIFIQTDKPIYKPGQKIRIRVLSIDKDFKPRGDKIDTAHVSVGGSRIKQWNNVTLEEGFASFEVQLPKEPVLGKYTITAVIGSNKKAQYVTVEKYVLPKFEVQIKPPKYMALDMKEFTTSICAKYTYGKNVKGKLNAVLCLEHKDYYYGRRGSPYGDTGSSTDFEECVNITREIDGCTDITLSRKILNIDGITNKWRTTFTVDASVTETLTDVTLKSHEEKRGFLRRSTQMSFSGTSNKFKPGLPFSYVLKVTHPDGTPAQGANVRVTISRGWYDKQYFYNKTFVVENGFIKDSIDDGTYNARSLVFRASLLDKNPYPTKDDYPVRTSFTAQPWFSPSFSYLEVLKTQSTPAQIGSDASMTVRYTVRNNTAEKVDFHYTVMCKRNIVLTGKRTQYHDYVEEALSPSTTTASTTTEQPTTTATPSKTNNRNATKANATLVKVVYPRWGWWRPKPDPVKKLGSRPVIEKFDIKFPVTMEMTPSCKIMVYYVRPDTEVVADTIHFDVEDRLENQVSVKFADGEKKPGEKTNLILKASPGSRVAFVAVDMSIHLLKAGNELSKDKIHSYLSSQVLGRAWSSNPKCRYSPWHGRKKRGIMPYWRDNTDYEDASEAFDEAGLVFLSNFAIYTKPCPKLISGSGSGMDILEDDEDFTSDSMQEKGLPGPVAPVRSRVTETTRNNKKLKVKEEPVRVRKEFPETWLWADEKLDESGNKTIQVTVPDTITTWVANGFAMSSRTGLGVSETAHLKVFQPFFVSMTLPYAVIRGEEIPVTVTVFNYMPSCVPIILRMNHKSLDYKVTSYYIHKLCVCGDGGQSVKFTIIPTKIGKIPLTVTATTSASSRLCSNSTVVVNDAVTRKLLVEPEGVRMEYTKGTFFCPKNKEYKEVFDLQLPEKFVPGSIYPTVTIIGDIMGPALNNLEDLLRMPYGCGEQNMANFAPNIYIMEYLTKTHQVTGNIKSKAINFMEIGYQRELTYKRKSGSYSAFGNRDAKGSMMLTAFVVRSFARAKKYIYVDDKEVQDSLKWFETKQNKETGCFASYGKLLNRRLQGGVNSELTITAYVTTALLEAGLSTDNKMVSKALQCITSQLDSIKETYATALVTYTLTLANHTDAGKMMKLLKKKATKTGNQMYWTESVKPTPKPRHYWYYPSSAEVEMTGYALLSILHQNGGQHVVTDEIMDIIRWLSKQRNSYGGFASTQDTCIALQALAEFAGKAYGDNADFRSSQLTGSLSMGNYYNHDFVITKDNKLTLQTVELPPKIIPGKLKLTGKGVGCALVQASVKYNVPEPEEEPAFSIGVAVRKRRSAPDEEASLCSPLRLEITTKWLKEDVSNMAVVDIKLVTGFSVREDSLKLLSNDPTLNFKRYDIDGQNIQLYFDEIKDMSFSIDIHQDTLVKKLKPAVVKVYDYYEPESQAKVLYKIGENECYGNKINTECPRCVTLENAEDLIKATVQCNSTVTKIRSTRGMMKVKKSYSKDGKKMVYKKYKSELEYQIPEFCPCDEIHDRTASIVVGRHNYFKQNGKKVTVVLNSGTTIFKWTGKPMKKQMKTIMSKLNACKRKGK